jgi:hypothetical protein
MLFGYLGPFIILLLLLDHAAIFVFHYVIFLVYCCLWLPAAAAFAFDCQICLFYGYFKALLSFSVLLYFAAALFDLCLNDLNAFFALSGIVIGVSVLVDYI